MTGLLGSFLPLDGGRGYVATTVIQCGTAIQAEAVKRAVEIALRGVVPDAYAVSADMAAAMQRDQHHAHEAPMPPHELAIAQHEEGVRAGLAIDEDEEEPPLRAAVGMEHAP